MATIRQRNGKWQVQVRRQGMPTASRTFVLKADAWKWAKQAEAEADRYGIVDRTVLHKLTVSALFIRFRDEVCPSRKGGANGAIIINAFLRSELAARKLSDLTPGDFSNYRDARLTSVQPSTINRELGLLQRIFELAISEWKIPLSDNPIRTIFKPRNGPPRERRLTETEWNCIVRASNQSRNQLLLPLVRFALATGMRRGELLNARWGDINWKADTLRIPLTKTGEPRTIPLSLEARLVLAKLAYDWCDEARIIPLSEEAVKLGWKRLVKRAGIEDLHFHDLRHEAISHFFEYGLSIPEVVLISGHKDPRMLFRYTHLKAEIIGSKLATIMAEARAK